jgi:hypothetical protein
MKKNYSIAVFEIDYGNIFAVFNESIKNRDGQRFDIRTDFVNIDILNYTYYF